MIRAATIALAFLLGLAGAFGHPVREAAGCGAKGQKVAASCCGEMCRCGDDCACAVDETPDAPHGEQPALPERSRGERTLVASWHAPGTTLVTLASPVDLGAFTRAETSPAAAPSCRLRLALVSRWTT